MRFFLWLCATTAFATGHRSLIFETNQGQADARAQFIARSPQATFAFTRTGLTSGAVTWTFPGAIPQSWQPSEKARQTVNSFIGPPQRWRRDIAAYRELRRNRLYPGIDLLAHSAGPHLEFDFLVHPGGDPRQIRLRFNQRLTLTPQGDLLIAGQLLQRRPITYQTSPQGERQEIASYFRLINHHEAAFAIGHYDPHRDLVIDPIVQSLTYVGGEGDDEIIGSDRGVTCGSSPSTDFLFGIAAPTASRRPQGRDAFCQSESMITYFGGSGDDRPTAFANLNGGILIAGTTTSTDFPVRTSESPSGYFLAFVPLYSNVGQWMATYWKGPITAMAGGNWPTGLATIATGETPSRLVLLDANFSEQAAITLPARIDRLTSDHREVIAAGTNDDRHVYLAKLASPSLDLRQTKIFGGSGADTLRALALDTNSIWLAGSTTSPDLPLKDPWQSALAGNQDGFVAAFDHQSLDLRRASYHGGSGDDTITAVQIDAVGVALAGTTSSTDLPVAPDADQPRFAGGQSDGFYLAVPRPNQPLATASYLGGPGDDEVNALSANRLTGNTTAPFDGPAIPTRSYRAGREGFQATLKFPAAPTITLGRALTTSFALPSNNTLVTARSSDPSRLLLSTPPENQLRPSVTASYSTIGLHGQTDSGEAELIISVPGQPEERIPVRLVPSGFAIRPVLNNWTLASGAGNSVFVAALDPLRGEVLAEQNLSPTETFTFPAIESSHPAVVEVREKYNLRAVGLGTATLRVQQPPGFQDTPPVQITVGNAHLRFTCPSFGQNLRTSGTFTSDGPVIPSLSIRIDDGSPVRLAFNSTAPETYGSLGTGNNPVWFDTSRASGTATFHVTAPGFEPADFTCPVYPTRFVFSSPGAVSVTLGQETQLGIVPQVQSPGPVSGTQIFSPSAPGQTVRVESTGVALDLPPVTIAPGSQTSFLKFTPRVEGRARLTLGSTFIDVNVIPRAPIRSLSPIVLGQFLSNQYPLFRDDSSPTTRLTFRAPPGTFLLRTSIDAVGQTEVSVTLRDSLGTFFVDALGQTGSFPLTVEWEGIDGKGQIAIPVDILPSGIGWANPSNADSVTTPWQGPLTLALIGSIDVDGGPRQLPVSPAIASQLRVRVTPSHLAESSADAPLNIQPLAVGLAELALETSLKLIPGQDKLRLRIVPPTMSLSPVIVGASLIETASLVTERRLNPRAPNPLRIRLTSSAPNILRLSESQGTLGQSSIEISTLASQIAYFVHGIAPGVATVTAEFDGGEAVTLPVTVFPTSIRFANHQPTQTADFNAAGEITLTAELSAVDSPRGPIRQSLRPGLDSLVVDVLIEPAGIVTATPSRLAFVPGSLTAGLRLSHRAPGRTRVTLVPPPGFVAPADGTHTIAIELNSPRLIWSPISPLGRNTYTQVQLGTSDGRATSSTVTITSSDPSRLLLSVNASDQPVARLTLPNFNGSRQITLHALGLEGSATVTAEGDGLPPIVQTVTIAPTAIALQSLPRSMNLGQSLGLVVYPILPNGASLQTRSGVNIPVSLRITPPGLLEAPAQVRLGESFQVKAIATGTVQIEPVPPPGYLPSPAPPPIVISPNTFVIPSQVTVGKDLTAPVSFYGNTAAEYEYTVTSSDPALVLVAPTALAAGQATLTGTSSGGREVYVQGLAARGTVTLTITAPGFAPSKIPVELVASGFRIDGDRSTRPVSVGAVTALKISPVALNPATPQALRPGVNVTPNLTTSDANIVRLTRRDALSFDAIAVSPGRARISLTQPTGFTAPAESQTLDFEVTDAFFSFDPPRVAQHLRTTATLTLTPAPTAARIPVRIVSRVPDLLTVASAPNNPSTAESIIEATNGTVTFYLDGLAATGNATLAVSAPGFRPFEIDLTLQPSGFIFNDNFATLYSDSTWSKSVRAVPVSALTRQPVLDNRDYRLRPGLDNLTLNFEVTGDTGLRLSPIALDNRPNWTPTATFTSKGTAIVTILPPPGFTTPSRNTSVSVTIQ